ncbi:MAG TPA: hypothetical protein VIQ81_01795 [Gammaproteobacteria bacterium]
MIRKHVILLSLLMLFAPLASADNDSVQLRGETWELSRHGEKLIKNAELSALVQAWSKHSDAQLEIRYPGGEEGELWSGELKGWLVSLGVPSTAIQTLPGSEAADIINIQLIEGFKPNE